MRLGLRLLLGFFVITGIAAFFVLRVFVAEVRPSVREVMEDMLVDTANILAELARDDLAQARAGSTLEGTRFAAAVRDYASRPVDAKIWGLSKRTLDYRVYVTDAAGHVVFDSGFREHDGAIGEDYSRWNDVARTLAGQYGARATREVAGDDSTSSLYVAAPIRQGDRLIGVLTVAKPTRTVQQFVERAQREILVKGFWLMGLSLVVGLLVTGWIVWSVRQLRRYAQRVQLGQALAAPALPGELGELARAMESMQQRLQGREHVEQVVRALTHELKSPLAAIGGAAELLRDDLPAADREAFAQQIQDQSARLRLLVERLLELSKLEQRGALEERSAVNLADCAQEAIDAVAANAAQRGVAIVWRSRDSVIVSGEAELIRLALSNLLENAIDFSPPGSEVEVAVTASTGTHTSPVRGPDHEAVISVRDHGPGVPEFALPRLGERFFSTQRPAAKGEIARKGSGLGLAIVRQIMALHGGRLVIEPMPAGVMVSLHVPTM